MGPKFREVHHMWIRLSQEPGARTVQETATRSLKIPREEPGDRSSCASGPLE